MPRVLPHHRLVAYEVAVELLQAIRSSPISDAKLRDEALRAAKSAVLNVAEGAGRFTRADKSRAFTIARGEGLEAFAALETAALGGDAAEEDVTRCLPIAERLYALLTGLITGRRLGGSRRGAGAGAGAGLGPREEVQGSGEAVQGSGEKVQGPRAEAQSEDRKAEGVEVPSSPPSDEGPRHPPNSFA